MRQILCVEDNEDSRELVKLALETRFPNVCVSIAGSIDEARELTESNNYDLFILDNWLPGGSGVDLCRFLREDGSIVPILFFSAAAHDNSRLDAMDAGATDYLVKPDDWDRLPHIVAKLLNGDLN